MRVKLVNQALAAGLIDPVARRSPFLNEKGEAVEIADVPENSFWVRRLRDGDVARVDDSAAPTGREPVAPLTTRGGK